MSIIIAVSGRKQAGKNFLCDYLTWYFRVSGDRYKNVPISQNENGEIVTKDEVGLMRRPLRLDLQIWNSKVYSFADPLKRFCIDVMGLREEQCYGTDADKNTETEYLWDNIHSEIRAKYGKEEVSHRMVHKEFGGMEFINSVKRIQRTGPMTGREVMQVFGTDVLRRQFNDGIWVNAALRMIHNEGYPISFISDMRFKSEAMALLKTKNAYVIRLQRKICEDAHESEKDLDDFDFKEVFGDRALVVDNQNMTIMEKNLAVVPFFNRILHDHSIEGLIAKKEAGEKNVS